jgi:hypothetical protein
MLHLKDEHRLSAYVAGLPIAPGGLANEPALPSVNKTETEPVAALAAVKNETLLEGRGGMTLNVPLLA